jgi:hypothetical protein
MTLVRGAELDGAQRADVRLDGATVTEIAPALDRHPGEAVLEARGGALLPGLCDHHLHLYALAAHDQSVRIEVREALAGYLGSQDDPGGPARRIRIATTADLVLLHTPLAEALRHPSADLVRATFIAGTLVVGD